MSIRTEQVDRYQTVFEVWERILDGHPEIVKQTVKEYAERPHGISADQHVEVLPIERVKYDLDERFFYEERRWKSIQTGHEHLYLWISNQTRLRIFLTYV